MIFIPVISYHSTISVGSYYVSYCIRVNLNFREISPFINRPVCTLVFWCSQIRWVGH